MSSWVITIFGGTGDLAYRKLFPALYNLYTLGTIDASFRIIGVGRREYTNDAYIETIKYGIKNYSRITYSEEKFLEYAKTIEYFKMDIENHREYEGLLEIYKNNLYSSPIFYFAVAPRFFIPIMEGLQSCDSCIMNAKVIIEKPFGESLESATHLNEQLSNAFRQEDIYHIDHYLGKEMVQNILSIRFLNAIFKGIWNKEHIEAVQINAFESVGVESRAGYYDQSGALKDMVQNHLLQILSIVAMEEPRGIGSSFIHDAQYRVLSEIAPIEPEKIDEYLVMGQYNGYTQEANVAESKTETYVAMKLEIDNERWRGVPFYIRTGKKLRTRESEVVIKFKATSQHADGNVLIIRIQPDEGVYLRFNIKKPGSISQTQEVSMDFCQSCILENRINTPEAYERLLKACMESDLSLFAKWDQIVLCWNYINDVIAAYKMYSNKLYPYEPNTLGPIEADALLLKDHQCWICESANSTLEE